MSQKNENHTSEPLGIAALLPRRATSILITASAEAKEFPPESIRRRQIIDKAIILVKREFPEFFFR